MEYTLNTIAKDGGPFNSMPANAHQLEDDKILCNNVILPWESNYHNTRLFIIAPNH